MRIVGLSGWSGAGKTTLLSRVIPLLVARGFAVSTVKHAHHRLGAALEDVEALVDPGLDPAVGHDLDIGTELPAARASSWAVVVVSVALTLACGVLIW